MIIDISKKSQTYSPAEFRMVLNYNNHLEWIECRYFRQFRDEPIYINNPLPKISTCLEFDGKDFYSEAVKSLKRMHYYDSVPPSYPLPYLYVFSRPLLSKCCFFVSYQDIELSSDIYSVHVNNSTVKVPELTTELESYQLYLHTTPYSIFNLIINQMNKTTGNSVPLDAELLKLFKPGVN